MNDPLRDNRIFPEEMHDKPPVAKKHSSFSWAWFFVATIVILILLSVGYFYTQKKTTNVVEPSQLGEFEKQVEIAEFIERQNPRLSEVERNQKIEILFGN